MPQPYHNKEDQASYQENGFYQGTRQAQTAGYDEGLRNHMLKVYNYMSSGVLLTGIIAMLFGQAMSNNAALAQMFFQSPMRWIIMLAPLAFVLVLSFGVNKMSSKTLQLVFWAFAATMGVSISGIFLIYTDASIARTFFITAASFGALSLYGYTTKRNLSGMGTFLFMGLFGLILASVVNMFIASSALQFITSVLGVLIFAGLTAYDTQRIKDDYYRLPAGEAASKGAIMGAVSLYLDFINLFMHLLRFLGDRE